MELICDETGEYCGHWNGEECTWDINDGEPDCVSDES